jgi:hypothetical protein
MSDINQNVNINVNANTQNAGEDISRLENNIKTLDGAVNLVGGSIEVLAGTLALTGAVTEEQAERFQTAAVGAIALADGSKRLLEGYKTLATETNILTKAQKLYNLAVNANPIGLLVTVLATATVAVVAFANAQNRGKTAAERKTEAIDAERIALEKLNSEQKLAQGLAQAEGASQEKLLELAVEQSKEQEEVLAKTLQAQFAINQFSEEYKKARAALTEQQNQTLIAETRLATFRTEQAKKEAEDQEKARLENTKFSEEKLTLKKKEIDFNAEIADSGLKLISATQAQAATLVQIEQAKSDKIRAINQAEQEYKELLLTEGVDNLQAALGALFGENKAIASANVLIDAAQAGVGIIKNSQTTGPFAIAYQATQFALLAATTAASLRQINSAEPGDTAAPNTPRGSAIPNTSFGLGTSTIAGATGTVAPTGFGRTEGTIRAYVLSSDVNNGLEADALLQTRRQFP